MYFCHNSFCFNFKRQSLASRVNWVCFKWMNWTLFSFVGSHYKRKLYQRCWSRVLSDAHWQSLIFQMDLLLASSLHVFLKIPNKTKEQQHNPTVFRVSKHTVMVVTAKPLNCKLEQILLLLWCRCLLDDGTKRPHSNTQGTKNCVWAWSLQSISRPWLHPLGKVHPWPLAPCCARWHLPLSAQITVLRSLSSSSVSWSVLIQTEGFVLTCLSSLFTAAKNRLSMPWESCKCPSQAFYTNSGSFLYL